MDLCLVLQCYSGQTLSGDVVDRLILVQSVSLRHSELHSWCPPCLLNSTAGSTFLLVTHLRGAVTRERHSQNLLFPLCPLPSLLPLSDFPQEHQLFWSQSGAASLQLAYSGVNKVAALQLGKYNASNRK